MLNLFIGFLSAQVDPEIQEHYDDATPPPGTPMSYVPSFAVSLSSSSGVSDAGDGAWQAKQRRRGGARRCYSFPVWRRATPMRVIVDELATVRRIPAATMGAG
ncbi:uncharacterized protein DS421_17g574350 [Arachis hypogaea]|nr:uncharacterized protein DS421_17g574350 [Arachis hypogaea]